jgi:putative transposase
VVCRVLGVSRSGYYAWLARVDQPPRGRAAADAETLAEINQIHLRFAYYGAPRIHRELLVRQHQAGRHRVARLMRLHGIRACRGKVKTRPRSAPPTRRPDISDRVQRHFHATTPDTLWFTDLTMIRTGQGWLRAAVILDAFNREVVSWAIADHETPQTALQALNDAIRVRRPAPGCVIHSDRGYQFTSAEWLNLSARHGLTTSIGERKSALDNAAMESWFASYKTEELYPNGQPTTRQEARSRLFRYIWDYNNHRLHSTLGYTPPRRYAAEESTCR